MDRADVRMGDERGNAGFAAEQIDGAGPGDLLRPQQLDGDVALEPPIAGPVDLGGPIAPDWLDELVVGNFQRSEAPARRKS
jgi:hypothetical protein